MAVNESLGNDGFLAKIDRLRATNVGSMIPLPQVIVVGDQSSGKSSALESLTGFAFPRAATLCTRYATQISCTRAPDKKITVSIIPRPDASGELKARLKAFRRDVGEIDSTELASIFQEANTAMGIRIENDLFSTNSSAFSEDILRIDIQGPEEVHLTLIDVPGIFRIPTPGLTTDDDIQLVRNMVQRYMANSRTIILTVIPCNVDIASQEILKLAAEADPDGVRTMGVLTKPDLLQEAATKKPVLELVEGQRNRLKLGYCVIANRGADDYTSTEDDRVAAENALFQSPPWSTCVNKDAFGTASLRERLRILLLEISQRELPSVRAEITAMRRSCSKKLMALGTPRADDISQRQHLVHLASQMQTVTRDALNGYYAGSGGLFEQRPELRLITRIIQLNESFADTFWKNGHIQQFRKEWSADGEFLLVRSDDTVQKNSKNADMPPLANEKAAEPTPAGEEVAESSKDGEDASGEDESDSEEGQPDDDDTNSSPATANGTPYDELQGITVRSYHCPAPKRGPLKPLIRKMYFSSRGPELGTFNGTLLAAVFRRVSIKWERLVLDHVSKAIVIVHDYIYKTLTKLCPERVVRDQLWDMLLRDSLCDRYQKAMDHTRSLLEIERTGLPVTLNHYFNSTLQKTRQERLVAKLEAYAKTIPVYSDTDRDYHTSSDKHVSLETLRNLSTDMDNSEHICDDILDTVESYYKVSRKRFVDIVCQHVVYHMLLVGPDSPLAVLSPETVLRLSKSQLEAIAGEDTVTRSQRETLRRQLESLDEAVKILRS